MATGGSASPDAVSRIRKGEGDFEKVDEINGIKVIKHKTSKNAKMPRVAGKSETYIVVNKDGEICYITKYDSHGLVREIDLNDGPIHAHTWHTVVTDNGTNIERV